jgi:hypothetical protein
MEKERKERGLAEERSSLTGKSFCIIMSAAEKMEKLNANSSG